MPKKSFRYRILKKLLEWSAKGYYRRMEVSGLENIPADKPVIYAAPHQNAMMDGLAVVINQKRQPYLIARADVFNNKTLGSILKSIRLVPIFRQRDKVDTRVMNAPIFEQCAKILEDNGSILIFPEANMFMQKRLRPLRKGLARIVFKAEEQNDFNLDVQVIPVGLDFSYYSRARSDLMVNFGKPISVKEYQSLYEEHPAKAFRKLTLDLQTKIQEQMIHIARDEDYEQMIFMCKMLYNKKNLKDDILNAQKKVFLVENMRNEAPEKYALLMKNLSEYKVQLNHLELKDWLIKTPPKHTKRGITLQFIIQLGLLPLWLYGEIMNFLPNKIPFFVIPILVGPQFKSSGIFVMSFFLFQLFYIVQSIIVYSLTDSVIFAILYFFTLPISGFFAVKYRENWRRNVFRLKLNRLWAWNPKVIKNLQKMRAKIIALIE